MSPSSDLVGPSPVTSNGTETTEIDDEIQEEEQNHNARVENSQPQQSQVCRRKLLSPRSRRRRRHPILTHMPATSL